jgi:hypothetical protein
MKLAEIKMKSAKTGNHQKGERAEIKKRYRKILA